MEEEKEYILHFYDGKVRRVTGKLSELQKLQVSKIEEAPVSFNPANVVRRDMERINRVLGQGFVQSPRQLLKKLGLNGVWPR